MLSKIKIKVDEDFSKYQPKPLSLMEIDNRVTIEIPRSIIERARQEKS